MYLAGKFIADAEHHSLTRYLDHAQELTLNSGHKIPVIGLGTWQSKPGEVQQAVEDAIDLGYRHFDCALAYENEGEIGQAIAKKIQEGVVTRQELFVTTKLPPVLIEPTLVREGFNTSLKRLGLDYVDLYLLHNAISINRDYIKTLPPGSVLKRPEDPSKFFRNVDHVAVWHELEKLVDEGLVRSIGVSNFNQQQLQRLIDHGRIKPAVLQVECHAYFPQHDLLAFCQRHHVVLEAYSPLGSPQRWGGNASGPVLLEDQVLTDIAKKHGRTPAQILLRSLVERGVVVLPKSVNKVRLQQNLQIWDFHLDDDDKHKMEHMGKNGKRLIDYATWVDSPNYPFQALL
ncbi:1,5-anhydro-D-fructose reductase-like isoform X2 [Paramacrobiotus metropolitanus]|uniref:1,5-anhydro-D-fructose reductase-like isoform X2 n=1 Tax=Paramacrobiotus metropolitanus TaxID=2943436 RepID=UPI002446331D|nr:1,5-anhydro-D-fructose reductase-like isoform X2 [Paramacrobiotus metropolitanus]